MKISVKTVKGSNFIVEAEPSTTIGDVKAKIETEQGSQFTKEHQVLIYQGKILKDDSTVGESNIEENKFLVIMVKKPAAAPAAAPAPVEKATEERMEVDKPAQQPSTEAAAPAPAQAETAGATASGSGGDVYSTAASTLATGSQLEQSISGIMEMGFPREEVMRAMRAAFNNPERAVEYLMSGIPPELAQPAAQPAPATGTPAAPAARGQAQTTPAAQAPTGPNVQPLDLFGGGGAAPQAAAQPAAGTGGLDFMRSNPQFQLIRQMVQANPQLLQPMLQELGKSNPQLLQMINANQAEFLRLLNEPVEGGDAMEALANAAGMMGGGMPVMEVELTQADEQAITRLQALGFERNACIEAFLACDKDEELAANYLMDMVDNQQG